mgnify:CR=1 FL=1
MRPLAVSRCDIDLPYVSGLLPPPRPFALGHECVGEVTAVGESVTSVRGRRPRDRAVPDLVRRVRALPPRVHRQLRVGAVPLRIRVAAAVERVGRALSDLIRVPYADAMLLPAPANVAPWALAAAADNATDGWRCVAPHLAARPGATVLVVIGVAPSIGSMPPTPRSRSGPDRVDVLSPIPEVLAVAERIGARRSSRASAASTDRTISPSTRRSTRAAWRSRSARPTTRASASARSTTSASRRRCPRPHVHQGHSLPFRALSRAPRDPDGRRRDRRRPSPRRDHRDAEGRLEGRGGGDGGAGE